MMGAGTNGVLVFALIAVLVAALPVSAARDTKLDEMSLERWAKLREVERYQLNIAEKYYSKGDYKIAMTEYEKFLKLYERSDAAISGQVRVPALTPTGLRFLRAGAARCVRQ